MSQIPRVAWQFLGSMRPGSLKRLGSLHFFSLGQQLLLKRPDYSESTMLGGCQASHVGTERPHRGTLRCHMSEWSLLDLPAQLKCQLNTAEWVASADARWSRGAQLPTRWGERFCCFKSLSFEVVCYTTDKLINKWNSLYIIYMLYIIIYNAHFHYYSWTFERKW